MSDVANLQIKVSADINDLKAQLAAGKISVQQFAQQTGVSLNAAGQQVNSLGLTAKESIDIYNAKMAEARGETVKTGVAIQALGAEATATGNKLTRAFYNLTDPISLAAGAVSRIRREVISLGLGVIIGEAIPFVIDFVSGLGNASKELDEVRKENDKFNESLKESVVKGTAAGITLQGFVDIAKDNTKSLEVRNEALKEANKIFGEHAEKLTLVNIGTAAATVEIKKFTEATIQQALAAKFADKAADLTIKQQEALEKLNAARREEFALQDRNDKLAQRAGVNLVVLQKEYDKVSSALAGVSTQLRNAQAASVGLFSNIDGPKATIGLIAEIEAKIKTLKDNQPSLLDARLIKVSQDEIKALEAQLDSLLGKEKKAGETIADVLKKLKETLGTIDKESIFDKLFGLDTSKDAEKKIQAIFETIKHLATKFHLDPKDAIIQKLLGDAEKIRFDEITKRIRDGFQAELKGTKLIIPPEAFDVGAAEQTGFAAANDYTEGLKRGLILRLKAFHIKFNPLGSPEEFQAQLDDYGDRLKKFEAEATKDLQQFAITGATAIGDAIGEGLANAGKNGGNVFGNLFSSLFKALGAGLRQLGIYAITTSKLIVALKANIGTTLGIAGGIALVALGTLISASASRLNKVPGFAGGGSVNGPGSGTSDSIAAQLSNGEYVIQASAVRNLGLPFLNALNAGRTPTTSQGSVRTIASEGFIASTEVSGQNLRIILNRADATYNRNS